MDFDGLIKKIEERCEALRISEREAGRRIGAEHAIANIKKRRVPGADTMENLARVLKFDAKEFMEAGDLPSDVDATTSGGTPPFDGDKLRVIIVRIEEWDRTQSGLMDPDDKASLIIMCYEFYMETGKDVADFDPVRFPNIIKLVLSRR